MSISVFIPCAGWHIKSVRAAIREYLLAPDKPEEIVLYATGLDESFSYKVDLNKLRDWTKGRVKIVTEKHLVEAGPSRNQAYKYCSSDIIMYQDADDLPHISRVKTIRKYFNDNPDVMALTHSYCYQNWSPDCISIRRVVNGDDLYKEYFPNNQLVDCTSHHAFGDICGFPVHAGVPCIKREVLETVPWKAAQDLKIAPKPRTKTEDFEFEMECLYHYKERYRVLDTRCYLYKK